MAFSQLRTAVKVLAVSRDSASTFIMVKIPAWQPDVLVFWPLGYLPDSIRGQVEHGSVLLARVNLKARQARDLDPCDLFMADDPTCYCLNCLEPIPDGGLGPFCSEECEQTFCAEG